MNVYYQEKEFFFCGFCEVLNQENLKTMFKLHLYINNIMNK